MSGRISEESHWAAFRYLAAELSEQERVRFEQQLADDPAACQAVADAVELTVAMAAAPAHVQRPAPVELARTAGRGARRWTMSLAGGLLLALLAGWAALRGGVFFAERTAPDAAPMGPELAIIWSRTTPPAPSEAVWQVEHPESGNPGDAPDPWNPGDTESPPDWVVSAVVAAAQAEVNAALPEPEGL